MQLLGKGLIECLELYRFSFLTCASFLIILISNIYWALSICETKCFTWITSLILLAVLMLETIIIPIFTWEKRGGGSKVNWSAQVILLCALWTRSILQSILNTQLLQTPFRPPASLVIQDNCIELLMALLQPPPSQEGLDGANSTRLHSLEIVTGLFSSAFVCIGLELSDTECANRLVPPSVASRRL